MRFLHQHEAEAVARGEMSPDEATVVMPAVPPLVKGGQYRSDAEVAQSGARLALWIFAGSILVIALVARGCA